MAVAFQYQVEPEPAQMTRLRRNAALGLICTIPLWFSIQTIADPFGQTEEGVNNAIWALGGRNIIHRGPWSAKLGSLVAPYPGTGGGVYAHHPPLPTWISAVIQTVSTSEVAPRLVALLLVAVSLALLFSILREYVTEATALISVSVVALSPWVLIYSRMLTTLTVATPLFVLLLRAVLHRLHFQRAWGTGTLLTTVGLVWSSWDGVIGAAALVAVLTGIDLRDAYRAHASIRHWIRALAPFAIWLSALVALLAYLIIANHGIGELVGQAMMRSGINQFPFRIWIGREIVFTGEGLGWITVALIALACAISWQTALGRRLFVALCLAAVPGLGMVLGFRNGAYYHEFWGYNLFIAASFAVAIVAERLKRALPERATVFLLLVLAAQAVMATRSAGTQLEREHDLNQLGIFLKQTVTNPGVQRLKMFWAYDFHPYVAWYLNIPQDVTLSPDGLRRRLETGEWKPEDLVVVDNLFAANLHCRGLADRIDSVSRRWSITSAGELERSCRSH
jgi:hypothetical protein